MNRSCLPLLLVAAAGAALAPAVASAAKAPVPRVWAVSYLHPGGQLDAVVTLRRAARVTVALSADRKLDRGDVVLVRRKLARRATGLHLAVPRRVPVGTRRLLVCARRCAHAFNVHVSATPIATRDLVAAAVARHKLTAGRALVFRIWAMFGDRRLPAAYRGDVAADVDDGVFAEAVATRRQLRAADRSAIAPYLLPPVSPRSWLAGGGGARPSATARTAVAAAAIAPGAGPAATAAKQQLSPRACDAQATSKHWRVVTGRHVRVWWWQEHGANRRAAATLVKVADRKIWPAFAKLMGRQPPSDVGRLCDGGDRHYDIYLLPEDIIDGTYRAVTLPFGPSCTGGPSFTEVNTHGGSDPPTRFELAHELFHAFEFAFKQQQDCGGYREHRWFDEASAVWASTWLFPHEEGTHERMPALSLISPGSSIDTFDYDAFPFVLDLQQRYGAGTVPAIYRAFRSHATSLQAIDSVLRGGFAATWRTFVRDAWNADPTGSQFVAWYGIHECPGSMSPTSACPGPRPTTLALNGAHAYRTDIDLYHSTASLTRRYDDLRFGDGVEQVTVRNRTAGNGRSDLQAFRHLRDGSWKVDDLTDRPVTTYCLRAEHVDRVVLAYGDHSIDDSRTHDSHGMLPVPRGPDVGALAVDVRDTCGHSFKVTGVTGNLDYTASYGANRYSGDRCTITGSVKNTAALDPDGHLGATDGQYDAGGLVLNIPVRWTGTLDYSSGCDDYTGPPCHLDVNDAGGPLVSGIADAGAPSIEAQISAPAPNLFNSCAGAFKDAYWTGGAHLVATAVPTSTLTSGKPFTLSWEERVEGAGRRTVAHLAATVTPVAENGGPLSDHPDVPEGKLE